MPFTAIWQLGLAIAEKSVCPFTAQNLLLFLKSLQRYTHRNIVFEKGDNKVVEGHDELTHGGGCLISP